MCCSAEQLCFLKKEDVDARNLDYEEFPQQAPTCENRKNKDGPVFIGEEGDDGKGEQALQNKVIELNAADDKTCNLWCKEGYYARAKQIGDDDLGDGNVANFKCSPDSDQTKRLGKSRDPLSCSSA